MSTPPRSVEEEAVLLVCPSHRQPQHDHFVGSSCQIGRDPWLMNRLLDALLHTRQDAARRAAEIARHLFVPADHEAPCGHLPERTLRNLLAEAIERDA